MTIDQQFNAINDKLQQLLKQHQRAQKEIDQLKEALEVQKTQTEAAQIEVQALRQQVSILKLANSDMNERDKKDFERQITQYVKQIDKCIAYLSQ